MRARVVAVWQAARGTPPARPGVGGALDELDDEFHAAYERSCAQVAMDMPVFVVLANDLVLLHGEQRRAWSFSPRAYHVLKEVAHVPLALFSSLGALDREPPEHALGRSHALLQWIGKAERELDRALFDDETVRELESVLARSASSLRAEPLTPAALRQLAHDTGPSLRRMIERATALQLDALHEHVEAALRELSREQIERLQVVVTGNHQARIRSLPMQYFRARLREPEGEERRVTYAEAVSSEQEALALLGTRALDRAIADAFFGDPTRMQRDLLGDAAHDLLAELDLRPIP
ncbi:MAG: hypothetical protein ABW352_06735 [Polyangiales bacterium]